MNIDLGYLGKVVLEEMEPWPIRDLYTGDLFFTVVMDGYTPDGIRVHAVVDKRPYARYPTVWNNAILIRV
jgi:hypothetical protein